MYSVCFCNYNEGNSLEVYNGVYETIEQIVEICKKEKVSVTVYDDHGFVKGWVHSTGEWTLA
jgi:TusA-related sulfurtransferase